MKQGTDYYYDSNEYKHIHTFKFEKSSEKRRTPANLVGQPQFEFGSFRCTYCRAYIRCIFINLNEREEKIYKDARKKLKGSERIVATKGTLKYNTVKKAYIGEGHAKLYIGNKQTNT